MLCENCGYQYNSGSTCPSCGHKATDDDYVAQKRNINPVRITILAIAILIFVFSCVKHSTILGIIGIIIGVASFAELEDTKTVKDTTRKSSQSYTSSNASKTSEKTITHSEPKIYIGEITYPLTHKSGQGLYKTYNYIDICVITTKRPNYNELELGGKLSLVKEPDNPYDKNAVAVYQKGKRIGYLYRGSGQDMTNDFLNRGDIVEANLTYIDADRDILKMYMAYYRNSPGKNDVKKNTSGTLDSGIVTTEEELEAYFIVKNLLGNIVNKEDILYKDTKSYMAVLYQGKATQWICRFYFNTATKYLAIPDENKKEERFVVENVYDIENYKDKLIMSLNRFI